MNMSVELIITGTILALLTLVLLYRVFNGPDIMDRVIALDSIDIILGLIMIIFGAYEKRGVYIDLGLIVTLLGFIGAVLISKYLEGKIWLF